MDLTKIVDNFHRCAQQQLNDAGIEKVVLDTYEELNTTPPDDIRIEYQETGDKPGPVQPRHYNVNIWTNSYLEPGYATTLEGRLRQAFDPNDNLYNFSVQFFNSE